MPRLAQQSEQLSDEELATLAFGDAKPQAAPAQAATPAQDEELSDEALAELAFGTSKPPQGGLGAHLSGAYETLGRAFAGSTLEGLGSLAGAGKIATQKLGAATGLPQEAPFFGGLEEGLTGAAKEIYPPETRGKGGPVEDVVAGAGSMAAAVPGIALGPAGAILTFGAQNGVPAYYDVLGATGDEEKATKALLFGAAVGQLEHFGAEKALGGIIKKLSGGAVGKQVKNLVLRYALGMGGEVGTEAAQTGLIDLFHEYLTDEDLDNWARIKKGLLPSAVLGGGAAVIDSSIERVVQERKAKGRTVADIGPETAPGGRIPQDVAQGTQAEPAGAVPPLPGEAQAAPQGAVLPGVPEGVRPGAEAQAGIQPGGEEAQPLQRGDLAGPLAEGTVPGVPPAEGVGVSPDIGGAEAATPSGPEVRGPVGQAGEATGGPVDVQETPSGEAESEAAAPEAEEEGDLSQAAGIGSARLGAHGLSVVDIRGGFEVSGEPGEYFMAQKSDEDGKYYAAHVKVPAALQGQGKGTKLYLEAAREAERLGSILRSSHEISDAAKATWDSLVRSGKAVRSKDGYEMLPSRRAAPDAEGVEKPKATGIKNATVERELEEMGVPLPKKAERKGFVEVHAKAMETLEQDSEAGTHLVEDLAAEPRAVTDEEDALLSFEANRLIRARDKAEVAFEKNPSEANKARVEKAKAEYAKAADVFDAAGRETGRGLAARKMMIARDYSLAAMERSMAQSKGDDLNAKESALVKELQKTITEKDAAIEKAKTAAELAQAEGRAAEAFNKLKKEAKRGKKRKAREEEIAQTKKELDEILERMGERFKHKAAAGGGALDLQTLQDTVLAAGKAIKLGVLKFDVWAGDMVARFGEGIRPFLKPAWDQAKSEETKTMTKPVAKRLAAGEALAESADDIRKIAASYVHDVKTAEELVDKVHDTLKSVDPNISRREVQDAISGHGIFRKLSKDETKVLLRERSGELRELSKLEDLLAGQKPAKTGFERRKPTAREAKLSDKTRALAKQLGFDVRKKSVRWSAGTANEAQVAAKKAAASIKSRKTRLQNEINSLNERVKTQDFGPKKKPEPQLDAETVKLMAEREESKRKFERAKTKLEYANRTRTQKVLGGVKEILIDLPRAIKSAYDVSAPFRQGVVFTVGHPIKSIGNVKRMFQALASERRALEIDVELRNRPLYQFGERSKLTLTRLDDDVTRPGEEAIQSKWSQKIPGIKASNRAFVTYLNLQRAQMFDLMVRALPSDPTLEQGKAIANFVNIATGRGNFGRFAGAAEGASLILWSPRLLLSRLQLIAGQPLIKGAPGTRKAIAKEYARFLMGMTAFYSLARMAQDAWGEDEISVEEDPRSSDFGKIKIGNTRIDPLGGLAQVTTLIARTISGKTKTSKGEVRDLVDDVKFGQDDLIDVYKRFVRSKLTPFLGSAVDLRTGENLVGEKVTPATSARDLVLPLSFNDIRNAMKEQGVPVGAAMGILAMFGMGLQTYEASRKKAIHYK